MQVSIEDTLVSPILYSLADPSQMPKVRNWAESVLQDHNKHPQPFNKTPIVNALFETAEPILPVVLYLREVNIPGADSPKPPMRHGEDPPDAWTLVFLISSESAPRFLEYLGVVDPNESKLSLDEMAFKTTFVAQYMANWASTYGTVGNWPAAQAMDLAEGAWRSIQALDSKGG
jgi:hypothetical protein